MDRNAIYINPPTSRAAREYEEMLVAHFMALEDEGEEAEARLSAMDARFGQMSRQDRYFYNRVSADLWQIADGERLKPQGDHDYWATVEAMVGDPSPQDWLTLLELARHDLELTARQRAVLRVLAYEALAQTAVARAFAAYASLQPVGLDEAVRPRSERFGLGRVASFDRARTIVRSAILLASARGLRPRTAFDRLQAPPSVLFPILGRRQDTVPA